VNVAGGVEGEDGGMREIFKSNALRAVDKRPGSPPTNVRTQGRGGVTVSSYLLRRRSADAPLCIEMRVTWIE